MQDVDDTDKVEAEELQGDDRCARCSKKGHAASKCTTELYCVICDGHDHVNHKCPLLKMPRAVAHAVGYAVHGLGFYHIQRPALSRAKKETKMALITVEGGNLSKEQVQKQMQRLFPGKWKWEIEEHKENAFITKFPSKAKLQRSIAFGGANVWEDGAPSGIRLKFDLWFEKKEGYLLPKVWISGMRKELREFLDLWAVGSMLGSTQSVDMEITRKSDFGRIFVVVLNPQLIQAQLDAVIGDHYFELEFKVEERGFDENGEEVDVEWCPGSGNDDNEEVPDTEMDTRAEAGDREAKRRRGNNARSEFNMDPQHFSSLKELVLGMSEDEFTAFLRKKAEEILDVSVKEVLAETTDKVLEERDDMEFGEGPRDITTGLANTFPKEIAETKRNKEAGGDQGKQQTQELAKKFPAAAIHEAVVSPVRSSPRLVGSSDEHTKERAHRRASARALELDEGMSASIPVNSCNLSDLLQCVGVRFEGS
ncbi:unnamed protein product [Urochloa humidicola]